MMTNKLKVCCRCKVSKSLELFYNCKRYKDGKQQKCIDCVKCYAEIQRQKKIEAGDYHPRNDMKAEDIPKAVEMYKNEMSCEDIGKILGYGRSTIRKYVKMQGINVRHVNFRRKHKIICEDYFETIDSQDKAYFLGLLWADGCNYRNDSKGKQAYQTVIALQERDKHILEELCLKIFENTDVMEFRKRDAPRQNSWNLRIPSVKMSDDLLRHGMHPRKSFTADWPLFLDEKFWKSFILGVYDGDGGIYKTKKGHYGMGIVGSPSFIDFAADFISHELGDKFNTYQRTYKSGGILKDVKSHGNKKTLKFLDWLYSGAEHKLDRKYKKYLDLKKLVSDKSVH